MNIKTERLASTMQKELQAILVRGLHDPRIRGLVTVTRVEIVDEGRIARAYISVLPEDKASLTMHGLRDATTHLRRALMEQVMVRTMPQLEIRYDEQARRQAETLRAIAAASAATGVVTDPAAEVSEGDSAGSDGAAGSAARATDAWGVDGRASNEPAGEPDRGGDRGGD